jgi:hypothetical protein
VVNALNGVSLKFGRYDFAAPTDGIAIRESGDGATLRYRWVGVSHIVKRESATGVADLDNDDQKAWIFEGNNIDLHVPVIRSVSLITVLGIDNKPGSERRYYTSGGEALFGLPDLFEGQFGYYRSRSKPHNSSVQEAEGTSWLLRGTHGWFKNHDPLGGMTAVIARGSGDRASTPGRFDGYLGETAAYGGESSIYVGTLVPRLRVDDDGGFPRRGLVNRRLFGLIGTDQKHSLLEPIPWILRVRSDVASRLTIVRYLHYGFDEQVGQTRAGSDEWQVETMIEAPKGVKYTVRWARVFPGGPLEALFPDEPWSLLTLVTVALKP